jgi:hypothetical protein
MYTLMAPQRSSGLMMNVQHDAERVARAKVAELFEHIAHMPGSVSTAEQLGVVSHPPEAVNAPAGPWGQQTVFVPTGPEGEWAPGDIAWIDFHGSRPARVTRKVQANLFQMCFEHRRQPRLERLTPHATAPTFVSSCAEPPLLVAAERVRSR